MNTIENGMLIVLLAECRIGGEHREFEDEVEVGKDLSKQEALYLINGRRAKLKEEASSDDNSDDEKALKDLKVDELRPIAEKLGVEDFASLKKADLITAIEAAQEAFTDDE